MRLLPRRSELLALLVAAAAGCREEGAPYDCTCTYLTDFDDAAKQETRVCAASPERAPGVARGCAQAGAPAPIQECSCRPSVGTCVDGCIER